MSTSKYSKYIGRTLDGRYRIDQLIGVGGMAVVFVAFDEKEQKKVALKLLREEIGSDLASVRRFINESKAVSMLDHPNIVKIYNVAVSDEYKYIVMEYIEGITLKKYMTKKKGALPQETTIAIGEQVLSALDHAHSKGIIHRDIKPHNIMLLKSGKVIVTDFGIAKFDKDNENVRDEETNGEKAVGTVFYISPEQASGKQTDARSDIYSLGAMMYEMATGKLPFYAEKPLDIARMQIEAIPVAPIEINSSVSKGLEQIILRAMEKDPEKRFASASEMRDYLMALHDDPLRVFSFDDNAQDYEEDEDDEDDEEEEEEAAPVKKVIHKDRSGSVFPIVAGACFSFLIVAIIVGYYAFQNIFLQSNLNVFKHDTSTEMTVGGYVDLDYSSELAKNLRSEGYNVNVTYEYNEDFPAGVICAQDPEEGSIRKVGKFTLNLTVSRGIESETIPNYAMSEYRRSKLDLEKRGFSVKVQYVKNDAIDTGYVIGTDPENGKVVAKGSPVTLFVSSGPTIANVTVPDFSGKTIQEMRLFFETSKLRLGKVSYGLSDQYGEGRISSQFPMPGSIVAEGEFINITISTGIKDPSDNVVIPEDEQENE